MSNHRITIDVNGESVETLEDILPEKPGLKLLFIAKVPTPDSVEGGHYFQGNQGIAFWNKLKEYNIIKVPVGKKEDDCLIDHGFGMIDIIRKPRRYADEPGSYEYGQGMIRVSRIIDTHKPNITVFVYKKVLDKLLEYKLKKKVATTYGFNNQYNDIFNSKVFVFPMPGTPCKSNEIADHMKTLRRELDLIKSIPDFR